MTLPRIGRASKAVAVQVSPCQSLVPLRLCPHPAGSVCFSLHSSWLCAAAAKAVLWSQPRPAQLPGPQGCSGQCLELHRCCGDRMHANGVNKWSKEEGPLLNLDYITSGLEREKLSLKLTNLFSDSWQACAGSSSYPIQSFPRLQTSP